MSNPSHAAFLRRAFTRRSLRGRPLGQILVSMGVVGTQDIIEALQEQGATGARLGDILVANGKISEFERADALAMHFDAFRFSETMTAISLTDPNDIHYAITNTCCFYRDLAGLEYIASDQIIQPGHLPNKWQNALSVLVPRSQIFDDHKRTIGKRLVERAERTVARAQSCRNFGNTTRKILPIVFIFCLIAMFFPFLVWKGAFMIAALGVALTFSFKLMTLLAFYLHSSRQSRPLNEPVSTPNPKPKVTVLIPLYKEERIAEHLLKQLDRLTYPKALLEALLILEEEDQVTRDTLAMCELPPWMRVITVPQGTIKTKPRAMNYALPYASGDIIGIFDAEDAPEPDQIEKIAQTFANAPENVGCLQGQLDYYNTWTNWRSRMFSIEYAAWFRCLLPGVRALNWVIPLGGTTVYCKRSALEKVGAWDAHNVTEDADLGVRFACHGVVTDLVHTTTYEEANHRAIPWIKQRSRWLKGYLITYLVHMRHPFETIRDMGLWKFIGFQLFFLSILVQFTCAPVLWAYWVIGFAKPEWSPLPSNYMGFFTALFIMMQILEWTIQFHGTRKSKHTGLWCWIPSNVLYFPFATLGMYKGIWELVRDPFYWDKTEHGITPEMHPTLDA